ncbi:hypothetical protein [Nocardia sp. NPDC050710]|uniref:hypothetical protein n=1 Tax=Nocardia sp. NPDC050710 TaxID=3157220 RepID=UPI0033D5E31C
MSTNGVAARRYDQQVKDSVLEALQQRLANAETTNAAVSATAAQFANLDGGGPSTSTVRNWGETAGLITPSAKRTKPARKPASGRHKADAVQVATTEPVDDTSPAAPTLTEPDVPEPNDDVDAIRAEATAPLLAALDEKDREIARLRDLVSDADIDLIARNKELEEELAMLRPLTELYLKKQRTTS